MNEARKKKEASELMMKVAVKVPVKKKIAKDFSPAERAKILEEIKKDQGKTKQSDGNDAVASSTIDNLRQGEEMQIIKDDKELDEKEYRRHMREVKRKARALEVGNKSKIIIYPSFSRNLTSEKQAKWYKMGNFSARYYAYRMAVRMGRDRPRIYTDKDKYYKMHAVVSTSNVDKLVNQALGLKEFDRLEETVDGIYILHMNRGLTDDEVAILNMTEKAEKEKMHTILKPKRGDPELFQKLLVMSRQLGKITNALIRTNYRIVGDELMRANYSMLNHYYYYADGIESITEMKGATTRLLCQLRAGLEQLGEAEVVGIEPLCMIGQTLAEIRSLLDEIKEKK